MEKTLTSFDRFKIAWRHQFLQGSWNFERMQNGGWAYAIIPAIKRLYPNKEEQKVALHRHLLFYNTHPYVSAPVMGVTLSLEEQRANGATISDETIQSVKVGMMGPLAGVGDPVFWFGARPILAAIGASLALSGNILGPILFFVVWNVMRFGFIWYTQEIGYKQGTSMIDKLTQSWLGRITKIASITGMFIIGALVQQWVRVDFTSMQSVQSNLDALLPGVAALAVTLGCVGLVKKNISPIYIIVGIFVVGILAHICHIL